jgi:hypothetical protein
VDTQNSNGKEPIVDENGDFIWRFRLEPERTKPVISEDAFAELFRSQLDEMLKLIVLTYRSQRVRVDGFYFINDSSRHYPIWSSHQSQETGKNTSSKPTK